LPDRGKERSVRLTEEKGDHERNEVDVNRLKIRLIINQLTVDGEDSS
jgi:hypothetical protein